MEKNLFFGTKAELFTNVHPPLTSGEGERGGEAGKSK